MRHILLLLFLVLMLPVMSFAQPKSSLIIEGRDEYRFILFINGQRQNEYASSRIRINAIPRFDCDIRIMFEDKRIPDMDMRIKLVDADNRHGELLYRLEMDRHGRPVLKYDGMWPPETNYIPEKGIYVVRYVHREEGHDREHGEHKEGWDRQREIDPVGQEAVPPVANFHPVDNNSNGCKYPMDAESFRAVKENIASIDFDDTKLSTAKTIANSNCLSAQQVLELCKLMSFEANKLAFAKHAYSRTTDKGNYFKVNAAFDFDSSKQDLNNFIGGGK